ncbi:hypothetical protein [Aquitalea sp. LB_tupeE]|uniref:hypothetical protein n=1 Tax=Aquitalea sp. LB_tupeE TaxID=2748078 RepID=UPI0015BAF580|nr:hypothetical protein [Aquitalea sp. LB_tupeE]NWK79622.1 hypothetical protein [Aquitalea sp. LB_tupeE]
MAEASLDLQRYQLEDGAIHLQHEGGVVDPYFAMKALLAADELGLDMRPVATAWIAWLQPRQETNGSFPRFIRGKNGEWRRFANADADDSTMALWLSLLYRVYGAPENMSLNLQQSLRKARKALLRLRAASGVFYYARGADLGYLMDNTEVLEALRDDCRYAGLGCQQADQLERAVVRVFWNSHRHAWRTATHGEPAAAFYPRSAAQLFPLMAGMRLPSGQPGLDEWLSAEGRPWLMQDEKKLDFAWGLLTLAVLKNQRDDVARQWWERAAPSRLGRRWNVLEEAIFQGLEQRFSLEEQEGK